MPNCRTVQGNLIAWIDGELSHWRSNRLQQHVAACPVCAAEAERLRRAVGLQRRALTEVTAVTDIQSGLLWSQLQRALHEPAQDRTPALGWLSAWALRPLALAGGAVAAAVLLAFVITGGPAAVLIPLGVESPPVAVKANPELFKDYQLIQRLDVLENFDTVESVPLDDDQTGQG